MKKAAAITGLLLLLALGGGCAQERDEFVTVPLPRIIVLFNRLKPGMTKEEAEAIVGKPVLQPILRPNGEEECWYYDKQEKDLELHESPWGPSGIKIIYKDGRLSGKEYNNQWIIKKEHANEYESKRNTGR